MRSKGWLAVSMAMAVGWFGVVAPVSAEPSVEVRTEQIRAGGKTWTVKTVRVDLTDPMLRIEPVTAEAGIGYDEPFDSMLARTGAVAGVNGTFFNAYEKEADIRYPNGLMMAGGETLHSGENQSLLLQADKTAAIRQIALGVRVTFIRGKVTSTYFPWGINKYYGDQETDQVVWYTPAMGREIAWTGTKVVIRENKVTEITERTVTVPTDGYVCFVGNSANNRQNLLPRIKVGDEVEAVTVAKNPVTDEDLDPGQWIAAIGVGPKLVTGGAVDVDYKRDGFEDPKITTQANRRSFAGLDREGRLVLGTMDGATVREEAEAALALGLTEAMNLDGGASSALYGDGRMLTAPGRPLSNALVVRRMEEAQVQIAVNGKFVPNFQGFIRNETTMVPIRPLLQAMGASFVWDGQAFQLTVKKDGQTLVLKAGDRTALWNGEARPLKEPAVLVDGHLVLPLRFMVETWGGKVDWDGSLFRAKVEIGGS
ncbi:phosphodiester glycosidase family protein [Gorillibacterium sp. sgz5001074]|uniref:phosphodiester glycosidase family protein n=1 Tax=Gorillibacterium sp. sgz5001074 TaxID=3446695 RepID=UPI003F6703F2